MSLRSLIGFFVGFLLLAPCVAIAQHWTHVRHPATGGDDVTPYFINVDTGFIYDVQNYPKVNHRAFCYRTTDAGADWFPVDAFEEHYYTISQIWFATRERGYLVADTLVGSSFAPLKFGLLFETTNAGLDWKQIPMDSLNVHSVYATGNAIFVTATPNGFSHTARLRIGMFPFADTASVYRSTDLGVTWQLMLTGPTRQPGSYLGLTEITGNRDSLVVVTAIDAATQSYIIYSQDLGNTWSYESLERLGFIGFQLQAYCLPYSCTVVRVLNDERLSGLDSFAFLQATPPFTKASWKWILDKETGGWFAGTSCAQYVGSADYSVPGFFQLRNGAIKQIGGPDEMEVDDDDFRNFSVVGHGAIVYASDHNGSGAFIQRTTDGGDGSLSAAVLAPQLNFEYRSIGGTEMADTVIVCDTGTIAVIERNMSCSLAHLDSVSVTGLDPSTYTVTVVRDSRCRGVGDSVLIGIRRGSLSSGEFIVRTFFSDDELNPFDTSFKHVLVRRSSRLSFLFALPGHLEAHAGDTLEIPVTVAVDPDAPVTISGNTHIGLLSTYDQNFLTPIGFESHLVGIAADNGTITPNGLEYALLAPNGFSVKTGDVVGAFRFIVRLADSVHSDFGFSVSAISSDDPRCLAASTNQTPLSVSLSPQCGDELIRSFMMTGQFTLSIDRVLPNPASNVVHVQYQNRTKQDAEYRILDALGGTRLEGVLPYDRSSIDLSLSHLPSGVYLLQLSSANVQPVSQRIVVNR